VTATWTPSCTKSSPRTLSVAAKADPAVHKWWRRIWPQVTPWLESHQHMLPSVAPPTYRPHGRNSTGTQESTNNLGLGRLQAAALE
jgi:hypothetical protein